MSIPSGIDLGTTFSSISWYNPVPRQVETIELVNCAEGQKAVRSVVYYPGSGQPAVVGNAAWNARRNWPERVVEGIKRSMGRNYQTPPIDGVSYTPQQVSAEVLRALIQETPAALAEEVKDVVITVPAHFGDVERSATEEAAKLAGLNVLATLPEPHAAALAFALDRVAEIADRYILVYDLGGGTFDVTLIHAQTDPGAGNTLNLRIDTLCKDGNQLLGGLDWDDVLADIVAEKAMREHGIEDPREDARVKAVLLDNCESAKRVLGRVQLTRVLADLAGHEVEVTRSEFEARTRSKLDQTEALLDVVLDEAQTKHGVSRDKIEILLAGGSTKMPMVREMVTAKMGKPPLLHGNPDLLVTIGAAYWAYLLTGVAIPKQTPDPDKPGEHVETKVTVGTHSLTDTTPYGVGVEVLRPDAQGQFVPFNRVLIPKGARYGQTFERDFGVADAGVTEIHVALYKGESENVAECAPIMTFTISGLPAGRPAGAPVRVTLKVDDNGIIRGKATDVGTGREVDIAIDRNAAAAQAQA